MNKYWRDRKWWIAIAVTIVVAVPSLVIPIFLTQHKRLTVEMISSDAIVGKNDRVADISVVVGGVAVSELNSQVFVVRNSGPAAIRVNDFEGPLSLEYACGDLVRARLLNVKPANLLPEIKSVEARVTIAPLLLNPGDSIMFSVLSSSHCVPRLKYHIADVPDEPLALKFVGLPVRYHIWDWGTGLLLYAIGSVLIFLLIKSKDDGAPIVLPPLRFKEIGVVAVLITSAGVSLLDNGARYYHFYDLVPSMILRLLLLVPWIAITIWLFKRSRPSVKIGTSAAKAQFPLWRL